MKHQVCKGRSQQVIHLLFLLQVGAATESELEDKKLRVEDAKNATFAAVEEGVVPGGGAALLHLRESIPAFKETLTNSEERLGADIVYKSLRVRYMMFCVLNAISHVTCISELYMLLFSHSADPLDRRLWDASGPKGGASADQQVIATSSCCWHLTAFCLHPEITQPCASCSSVFLWGGRLSSSM